MAMGIYTITNTQNGMQYIGQSICIEKRWREHAQYLRSSTHVSKKLQEEWNVLGKEGFTFSILEELPADQLDEGERRQMELRFARTGDHGYNTQPARIHTAQWREREEADREMRREERLRLVNEHLSADISEQMTVLTPSQLTVLAFRKASECADDIVSKHLGDWEIRVYWEKHYVTLFILEATQNGLVKGFLPQDKSEYNAVSL